LIIAIDLTTGKKSWEIFTRGSVCGPPAIDDSLGFALSHDKKMYVFNLKTGMIRDTIQEDYILCGTPSISNKEVLYPDWGGNIHCRFITSGKKKWTFSSGKQSKWFSSPSISDSIVYFVSSDSILFAVSLKLGSEKWRYKAKGNISRAPSFTDSILVFTTSNSHLYALSKNNGKLLWEYVSTGTTWSYPVIVSNIVYYGCGDGKLYAFDIHTGELIWSFSSDNSVNTPVLSDEAIFFTSGQYLYKIE